MQEARTYTLMGIADGPEGVRQTLAIMRRLVKQYKTHPDILETAHAIIQSVPSKDAPAEIDALRTWIRGNIRYTDDINGVETLQTPAVLLQSRMGDCDDQATLMATFAEAIGKPARFAAIAFQPDQFEHVITEVKLGTRWIAAETTEPVGLGWYPPNVFSRMTEHI